MTFLKKHGAFTALILIVILATFRYDAFLSQNNIINLFRQNSMLGYVAIGMTFVILTRGIDLSVGSLLAIGGITAAYLSPYGIALAIIVPLLLTTLLGMVNGLIIAKGRIEPFIVTLAMMIGIRGLVYVVTDERSVTVHESVKGTFEFLGRGVLLGIPVPVWIFIILLTVTSFILKYSPFGRHVYAIGGNEEASKLMGVNVIRVKLTVYSISGLLSGFAGIVLASRLGGVAQPVAGNMWELDAIAAVVIGGTLLTGGRGHMFGTFIGVMLLGVILNVINMEGTINSWWQPVIRGVFLTVIVVLQARLLNKSKSGLQHQA